MKVLSTLLILITCLSVAQVRSVNSGEAQGRLLDRMNFYGITVDAVASPDTVIESIRYVTLLQENTERQCDYKLYISKPHKSQYFFVKKFTIDISREDTVVTESPLVELSLRHSARLDRFFQKASHIDTAPYSVHYGSFGVTKKEPKMVERKDYWRMEVRQNSPYKPFLNRWKQANPHYKDPVNTGLIFLLRQKIAISSLRRTLREFSSCP